MKEREKIESSCNFKTLYLGFGLDVNNCFLSLINTISYSYSKRNFKLFKNMQGILLRILGRLMFL